jgi:hypothetical protein
VIEEVYENQRWHLAVGWSDTLFLTERPHLSTRTGDRAAVRADDLFGVVAETVLLHGGDVLALARNDMPTETGVAAIYRYA